MPFEATKKVRYDLAVSGEGRLLSALRGVSGGFAAARGAVLATSSALSALGFTAVAASFVTAIAGATKYKARLADVSEQTGIAVEQLASLDRVAQYSGTSLETLTGASTKLSKALATSNEDSKGAAQAIKALGLDYEAFRKLEPDQQMLAIAKAMDGVEKGTGKTAAAMLLFGKTGAELLPFLKELAELGLPQVTAQSTDSALAAKELEDNLTTLGLVSQDLAAKIANPLLPVLNDLLRTFNERGLLAALSKAGDNAFDFKETQFSKQMRVYEADMVRLQSEAQAAGVALAELGQVPGIADKARQIKALRDSFLGITDGSAGGGRGFVNPPAVKRKLPDFDDDDDAKKKAAADPFTTLSNSLKEQIALQQAQQSSMGKLTAAQQLQVKTYADIDNGVIKLTLDQKLAVDGWLQELLALEALGVEKDRTLARSAQLQNDMEAELEAGDRQTQATRQQAGELQRQIQTYGFSREALEALSIAEDRETAALLRQKAAALGLTGAFEDRRLQLLAEADALDLVAGRRETLERLDARERTDPVAGAQRAVKDYLRELGDAGIATERIVGNAARNLEDGLTSLFTGGRFEARRFIDDLIAEFFRLQVVRPLLADVFGSAGSGGGFGGLLGGLGLGPSAINPAFGLPNYAILPGRANGGPVSRDTPYMVGERGPELFVPQIAGTVLPNGAGGTTIQINQAPIHIDARSDRAQVAVLVSQAVAQGNRQLIESLRARGALV